MKILLLTLIFSAMIFSNCSTPQIMPANNSQPSDAPVILAFTSYPSTIHPGVSSTLSWKVTGATSVSIDQGIGQVAIISGIRTVSPASTTMYTLNATGAGKTVTASSTVTVSSSFTPNLPMTPVLPPSAVTRIFAGTEPSGGTGCYTLYADIYTNGACTVSYMWESTEGSGSSYNWAIYFKRADIQRVTLPAEMSALPAGQYRLHILSPNNMLSNTTYYPGCR